MIRDFVLAGGKRIRPQLACWTYRTAAADASQMPAVFEMAVAWELFHAFLLVHDDIIDASLMRRERQSLHHQLASLDSESLVFGKNLGIVAGDLLFSASMSIVHELDGVEPKVHRDLLRLFSRTACTTGFGQAIDICSSHMPMDQVDEATLLRCYHWKTAAYTFEGPMLTGAVLAGADAACQAALSEFALALGQAYQLQNDLNDLRQPASLACDLVQGKRTVTLLRHRMRLDETARRQFDADLASIAAASRSKVIQAETLRQELIQAGSVAATQALIATLLEQARNATIDGRLPESLAVGTGRILDTLAEAYFATAT